MSPLRRIKLNKLNEHLVCVLCSGYFVEATTIIECLHTFCKSCIVTYLSATDNKFCPVCDIQIHKVKPMKALREDKTLQDVVYKLVPGLFRNEISRRVKFYKKNPQAVGDRTEKALKERRHFFHVDDQISLSLEFLPPAHVHAHALDLRALRAPSMLFSLPQTQKKAQTQNSGEKNNGTKESSDKEGENGNDSNGKGKSDEEEEVEKVQVPVRRYLRCPAAVHIRHLEKFLRAKYRLSQEYRVDIVHGGDCLSPELTLLDVVYMYKWTEDEPLKLQYTVIAPTLPLRKRPRPLVNKMKWQTPGASPPKKAKFSLDSINEKAPLAISDHIGLSADSNGKLLKEEKNVKCEEKSMKSESLDLKAEKHDDKDQENIDDMETNPCNSMNSSRDDGEDAMVIDESINDYTGQSGDMENETEIEKEQTSATTCSNSNVIAGGVCDTSAKLSIVDNSCNRTHCHLAQNSSIESLKALVNSPNYPGYSSKSLLDSTHSTKSGVTEACTISSVLSNSSRIGNGQLFVPKVPTSHNSSMPPSSNSSVQNNTPLNSASPSPVPSNCNEDATIKALSTIKASDISESPAVSETASNSDQLTDEFAQKNLVSNVNQSALANQCNIPQVSVNSDSPKQLPRLQASPVINPVQSQKSNNSQNVPIHKQVRSPNCSSNSVYSSAAPVVCNPQVSQLTTSAAIITTVPTAYAKPSPALLTPMTMGTHSLVSLHSQIPTLSAPSPSLLTPMPIAASTHSNSVITSSQQTITSQAGQQRTCMISNPRLISSTYRPKLAPRLPGTPYPIDPTKPRLGRPPNSSRILAGRMSPQYIQPSASPQPPIINRPVAPKGRGRPKGTTNVEKANKLLAAKTKQPTPSNNRTILPAAQNNPQEMAINSVNPSSSNLVPMENGQNPVEVTTILDTPSFLKQMSANSHNLSLQSISNKQTNVSATSNKNCEPSDNNSLTVQSSNKSTIQPNNKNMIQSNKKSTGQHGDKNPSQSNNNLPQPNNKNLNMSHGSNVTVTTTGNNLPVSSANSNMTNNKSSIITTSSMQISAAAGNKAVYVTSNNLNTNVSCNSTTLKTSYSNVNGNTAKFDISNNACLSPIHTAHSTATTAVKSPKLEIPKSSSTLSTTQTSKPQNTVPNTKSVKSPVKSKTPGGATKINNIAQNLANSKLQQKNLKSLSLANNKSNNSLSQDQFSNALASSSLAHHFNTSQFSPTQLAALALHSATNAAPFNITQYMQAQTLLAATASYYSNLSNFPHVSTPQYDEFKKVESSQPMDLSPTNKGAPNSAISETSKQQKSSSAKPSFNKTNFPKLSQIKSPKNISLSPSSPKVSITNGSHPSNISPPTSEVTITKLPSTSEATTSTTIGTNSSTVTMTKSSHTNTISITKRPSSNSSSNSNGGKFGLTKTHSNASIRQIPNPSHLSHQSEVRNNTPTKPTPKTSSPVTISNNNNNNNNNNNKMVKVDS